MQLETKSIVSSTLIALAGLAAAIVVVVFARETDNLRFGIVAIDGWILVLGVVATAAASAAFGRAQNFRAIIRRLWFVTLTVLIVATAACIVLAPNPRSPYLGP
jgi:uncharacterized membrane protein